MSILHFNQYQQKKRNTPNYRVSVTHYVFDVYLECILLGCIIILEKYSTIYHTDELEHSCV